MMRLLHIVPGNLFGGVESTLLIRSRFRDVCPALLFEVAVCFEGRLSGELAELGTPVHMLGEVRVSNPLKLWRARRKLRELLRNRTFDIVLCHLPWVEAIFGPIVQSEGIHLAFGVHGMPNGLHWSERWAARIRPDIIICVSRFLAAQTAKIYPGVFTEVVYNPVAPVLRPAQSERMAVRAEAKTPAEAVVIIQVGRIEPGKGHGVCLEALGLLRDQPGWELWQIGGPQRPVEVEYFRGLRQQAARLGIAQRVRFRGQRSDVAGLLAAADIYCQPNDTVPEGLGNSFVEALYAGLPVVTSAMGGATEIVDETCGFLLPPGDVRAVSATLGKLICDPDLRMRLGAGGPPRAARLFAPEVQIPRLYETLEKVVYRHRIQSVRDEPAAATCVHERPA